MESEPDKKEKFEPLIEMGVNPQDLDVVLGNTEELEEKLNNAINMDGLNGNVKSLIAFIGQLPCNNPMQREAIKTMEEMVFEKYLDKEGVDNKDRWNAVNEMHPIPSPLHARCLREIFENVKDPEDYLNIGIVAMEAIMVLPDREEEDIAVMAFDKFVDSSENLEQLEIVLKHSSSYSRGSSGTWANLRIKTTEKMLQIFRNQKGI